MDQYQAYLDQLDRVFLSPSVREGFNYWRGLLRGRRFAARSDLDPVAMPSQLHRITLVDVEHDPPRFRTRLLGQHNRDRQGIPAGSDFSDVGVAQGRERILARLRLCVAEGRPIRGTYRYEPLAGPDQQVWAEVASCPLSSDGNTINHIVSFGSDFDFTPPPGLREWP
ncbi:MAG: hypothetical protein IT563_08695 [Alphaproteobacteria bacterium]|nr:hypothetical protein [Alphaproteobacteria bacterium]